MLGVAPPATPEADAAAARNIVIEAQALGLDKPVSAAATSAEGNPEDESLAAALPATDQDEPILSGAAEFSSANTISENSVGDLYPPATSAPSDASFISPAGSAASAAAPAPEPASLPAPARPT